MKRKASISHDKAIVEELRRDPEFAADYLYPSRELLPTGRVGSQ